MAVEPDIVDILHDEIVAAAHRNGLRDREAIDIAFSVEERLRRELGGQRAYVPGPDIEARNKRILEAYDGTNGAEICRRFGISYWILRRIVGKKNNEDSE